MKIDTPADVTADLEAVCSSIAAGRCADPDVVQRIRNRAKKVREVIIREHGLQEIGVQLIREHRDG